LLLREAVAFIGAETYWVGGGLLHGRLLLHDDVSALFVERVDALLGELDQGVDQALLLGEEPLELVLLQFLLELVVDEPLPHQLADDDLNLCPLLQEAIVLADLYLIVLDELQQLVLSWALVGNGPVSFLNPPPLLLNFFLRQGLVRVEEFSELGVQVFKTQVKVVVQTRRTSFEHVVNQ
jgi:hypothetical protein